MTRPRIQVTSVTIATPKPSKLAAFYARLLGWPIVAEDPPIPDDPARGGWAQLRPPDGEIGPTLNFEFEPHFVRPTWPSAAGDQITTQHLDLWVDELEDSVAWAESQGAELAECQPQEHVRVLLDPDGHPFCLCR